MICGNLKSITAGGGFGRETFVTSYQKSELLGNSARCEHPTWWVGEELITNPREKKYKNSENMTCPVESRSRRQPAPGRDFSYNWS